MPSVMTMAHHSPAGSVSGSLSPCWSICSPALMLPHTRASARGAAVERLSGAPEGQPSVISVRKSARLCGASPGARGQKRPRGGGQQQGSGTGLGSCRAQLCLYGMEGLLSFHPEQSTAPASTRATPRGRVRLLWSWRHLQGWKISWGCCTDHRVTHRAGTFTCKGAEQFQGVRNPHWKRKAWDGAVRGSLGSWSLPSGIA